MEPAALTLDPLSATLDYSQRVTLTAIGSEGRKSITWTSSDENIVRLSATSGETITVVGVNAGVATITCISGELMQTCEVTVRAPETLQITGVDYPSTLNAERPMWLLRLGTVASVDDLSTLTSEIKDANGELIGNSYMQTFSEGKKRYEIKGIDDYVPFSRISAEGQYMWTLTATDVSGRLVSMSMPINATASEETAVASDPGVYSSSFIATEIILDSVELAVQSGETCTLNATVIPSEAVNDVVTWTSDDPSVATVTQSGEVTAVRGGSTTIRCTVPGSLDVSASCAVTVTEEKLQDPVTENAEKDAVSAEETLGRGRNLILNSSFEGIADAGIYTFNGDEVTFHATEFNAENHSFNLELSEYGLENIIGSTLLFSMEYRIDEALEFGTTNPWVGFELGIVRDETTGGSNQWLDWYGWSNIPTSPTSDWTQYSCVVQVSDYDAANIPSVWVLFRDTKGTISFRHPMIEIISTDWSSAPEDFDVGDQTT